MLVRPVSLLNEVSSAIEPAVRCRVTAEMTHSQMYGADTRLSSRGNSFSSAEASVYLNIVVSFVE